MRHLTASLLLLLAAAAAPMASAQEAPDSEPDRRLLRPLGEDILLTTTGLMAGATSAMIVGGFAHLGDAPLSVGVPLGIAGGLTGMALGVHGTARLIGVDGTLANALGDAFSGGAVGVATIGVTVGAIQLLQEGGATCSGTYLWCLHPLVEATATVGFATAVLIPVLWVVSDYRSVEPALIYSQGGDAVPGLSIRVGL